MKERRIISNVSRKEPRTITPKAVWPGVHVETLNKAITGKKPPTQKKTDMKRVNARKPIRVPKIPNKKPSAEAIHQPARPSDRRLTSLLQKTIRLPLPPGSFNAGLTAFGEQYICVYRPNEYGFSAIVLNKNFTIDWRTGLKMGITNCADPRLFWVGSKLLMVYSSNEEGGLRYECIRGAVIMDLNKGPEFIQPEPFRISPKSDIRQKNWMPFIHDGKIYLIASVNPHIIYELPAIGAVAEKRFSTDWLSPWFYEEFHRGNTNPVQLDDGNFLGTFHTAVKIDRCHHYDNGCYLFEGKPPFRVLRAANRTYLPAESAVEPHFRKGGVIQVNFPVGMVREGERLLISYGDNDSAVKIMETTVKDMLETTLEVY